MSVPSVPSVPSAWINKRGGHRSRVPHVQGGLTVWVHASVVGVHASPSVVGVVCGGVSTRDVKTGNTGATSGRTEAVLVTEAQFVAAVPVPAINRYIKYAYLK